MNIETWGKVIGILLGVGTVGKTLYTYVYKPTMLSLQNKKTRDNKLDSIINEIGDLKAQFMTNGGSTIKDQLNRIEIRQLFNEQVAQVAINNMGLGVWRSDIKGYITDVSPTLVRMLDRAESEIKGNNWMTWIHPEDRRNVIEEWSRCVDARSEFSMGYRYVKTDGSIINVYGNAYPVISAKGMILGFVGILTNLESK